MSLDWNKSFILEIITFLIQLLVWNWWCCNGCFLFQSGLFHSVAWNVHFDWGILYSDNSESIYNQRMDGRSPRAEWGEIWPWLRLLLQWWYAESEYIDIQIKRKIIFSPIKQGLLNHDKEQKIFISMKVIDYYQVFLVAGGYDYSDLLSSTETLVEGDQAWNFQQPLPSGRGGLQGISLADTVIMTGKKVLTFTFSRQSIKPFCKKSFNIKRSYRKWSNHYMHLLI